MYRILPIALLAACGGAATPTTTAEGTPAGGDLQGTTVNLDVEDGRLADVVRLLAHALDTPVIIDPQAQSIARCAQITVVSPRPVEVSQVARLLDAALRPSGLRLEIRDEGVLVRRDPNVEAPQCSQREAAATAPEVDDPGQELRPGLRRVGEHDYVVTRTFLDEMLSDPESVARSARLIPHQVDGRVVGVRIYGLRRTSTLVDLGLLNGDVLMTLNGHELTSPETTLEAYSDMRGASRVDLAIERRGQPVTLTYSVGPD